MLTGVVVYPIAAALAAFVAWRAARGGDDALLNFADILLGFALYRMLRHSVASVTPA